MSGLLQKQNENFWILYDAKGRFRLHSFKDEEAKYKLCKVHSVQFGDKGIPYLNTYDGRTIKLYVGIGYRRSQQRLHLNH
jgi:ribosomal protein S4E